MIKSDAANLAGGDITNDPKKFLQALGWQAIEDIRNQQLRLQRMPKHSRVLIVDEFSISGNSLYTAKLLLETAFPDLEFDTVALVQERLPYNMQDPENMGMEPDPLFYIKDEDEGWHYGAPWSTHGFEDNPEGLGGTVGTDDFLAKPVYDTEIPGIRKKISKLREELQNLVEEEYQRDVSSRN